MRSPRRRRVERVHPESNHWPSKLRTVEGIKREIRRMNESHGSHFIRVGPNRKSLHVTYGRLFGYDDYRITYRCSDIENFDEDNFDEDNFDV